MQTLSMTDLLLLLSLFFSFFFFFQRRINVWDKSPKNTNNPSIDLYLIFLHLNWLWERYSLKMQTLSMTDLLLLLSTLFSMGGKWKWIWKWVVWYMVVIWKMERCMDEDKWNLVGVWVKVWWSGQTSRHVFLTTRKWCHSQWSTQKF